MLVLHAPRRRSSKAQARRFAEPAADLRLGSFVTPNALHSATHAIMMWLYLILFAAAIAAEDGDVEPRMSDERCVFQTKYGDIEFGFYAEASTFGRTRVPGCPWTHGG
jgi:hypothetical protein